MPFPVKPEFLQRVTQAVGATQVTQVQRLQSLWGGYGGLLRLELRGSDHSSVIVKHIQLPQPSEHPHGWNSARSHQRKLRSYQVEVNWYQQYATSEHTVAPCPMPNCLFVEQTGNEILLVLEDLNTRGFQRVLERATTTEIQSCLRWLAHFHARHLHNKPVGLWETGTYWHLDTRPDEFASLDDIPLKNAAADIDAVLRQCPFQTFVHGDAKLANFVFSCDSETVAAVDFQYVGKGCGMQDVILLLSSTVSPNDCEKRCPQFLDDYFAALHRAVTLRNAKRAGPVIDVLQLEQAWRPLYSVAWADFQRFLKGWSPGHWKIHAYSNNLTQQVIRQLGSG